MTTTKKCVICDKPTVHGAKINGAWFPMHTTCFKSYARRLEGIC